MDRPLQIDRTVNINTIIALATFIIMVIGGVVTATLVYGRLQAQSDAWIEFQKRQESYNARLDTDVAARRATVDTRMQALVDLVGKLSGVTDQQSYQVAQLQKKDEETDQRLGRMSDSYGDKFTEIQSTLATMSTQLALQSQALTELKQIVGGAAIKPH